MVTVPAALVKAPPFIEYSPLAILMGNAVLKPVMVIAAEVTFEFTATPVTAGKLNVSGVVSIAATLLVAALEELPGELRLEIFNELLSKLLLELLIGLELGGTGSGFLPPPPPPPQAASELTRPRIKSLRIPV